LSCADDSYSNWTTQSLPPWSGESKSAEAIVNIDSASAIMAYKSGKKAIAEYGRKRLLQRHSITYGSRTALPGRKITLLKLCQNFAET
jgi:hypothetical protein